jgi:hypothetical protein|tara:strand:+ start:7021 stop:8058 length:1038 start_codon:yes stop_codon:yes gene_type:complete
MAKRSLPLQHWSNALWSTLAGKLPLRTRRPKKLPLNNKDGSTDAGGFTPFFAAIWQSREARSCQDSKADSLKSVAWHAVAYRPAPALMLGIMSFSDYLNGFAPADGMMHLMHSTTVATGASIIVQGELRTRPCTVYGGEDLLYLFYGRPAFKPLAGALPSGIDEHLPMCLVIDPDLLGEAIRILPFDSGGYSRYSNHTGVAVTRPDFELGPGCEIPMRLVRAFFDTNSNYYHQKPTADQGAIPITQLAARAFARLASDPALADDDDRRSTIEIQIGKTVPLAKALRAVIAPPVLLSDAEVMRTLDALPDVKRVTYSTYGRQQPTAYVGTVYDKVASFLIGEGVMS